MEGNRSRNLSSLDQRKGVCNSSPTSYASSAKTARGPLMERQELHLLSWKEFHRFGRQPEQAVDRRETR